MKSKIIYNRSFQKALAVFSFFGFALSLIIHSFSVLGTNIISSNSLYFFLFHFLVFLPFGILVVVSQPQSKLHKMTVGNDYQKWFFSPMPKWTKFAVYIFSGYVLLNFIFCLPMIATAKAKILDGKYVLIPIKKEVVPQNIIREISPQEYELQTSYETRSVSGHWMIFYLMPALFFWYKREDPTWSTSPNQQND